MPSINGILGLFGLARKGHESPTRDNQTRYPGGPDRFSDEFGADRFIGPEFEEALTRGATAYAASQRIAKDCASVPYKFTRKGDTETEVTASENETVALFESINGVQGKSSFWQEHWLSMIGDGNAYTLLDKQGLPTVQEFFKLPPTKIKIVPGKARRAEGYLYDTGGGAKPVRYQPEEVIHDKFPNPLNEWYGLPPLHAAQLATALEMKILTHAWHYFKRGTKMSGVVHFPEELTAPQRREYRKEIEETYGNADHPYRFGIFDGGSKYSDVGQTPQEAEMLGMLRIARDMQASVIGTPLALIGIVDQVKYATAPEQMKVYWLNTIRGLLSMLEESINEVWLPRLGEVDLTCRFDLEGVEAVQEMQLAKAEKFNILMGLGAISPDEVAAEIGNDPSPTGGDQRFINSSLFPLGFTPDVGPELETAPEPSEFGAHNGRTKGLIDTPERNVKRQEALEGLERFESPARKEIDEFLKAQIDRILAKVRKAPERLFSNYKDGVLDGAVKKQINVTISQVFSTREEIRLTQGLLVKVTTGIVEKQVPAALAQVGASADTLIISDPKIVDFIQNRALNKSKVVTETTKRRLTGILSSAVEDGWSRSQLVSFIADTKTQSLVRANLIARTEVTTAFNFSTQVAWEESDVVESKEWLSAGDSEVRGPPESDFNHAIDGERVGMKASFSNGLLFPGDPSGDAGNVINCRCTMTPSVKKPTRTVRRIEVRDGLLADLRKRAGSNGAASTPDLLGVDR